MRPGKSHGSSYETAHFAEISGKKSYSFNTIKYMTQLETETKMLKLLFMVSADHFQGRWPKFRKWFKWKELLNHSGLLINQRPGHKINLAFIKQLKQINTEIFIIEADNSVNVSSSELRRATNQLREEKLSQDVFGYIIDNGLY